MLLLTGFTALGTLVAAEKQATTDLGNYPFWSSKKRGPTPQFVPGLTAALQLSDAQKKDIAAAREEMMNDAAVKAARGISKSDPNVTAEQRDKARATVDAANARLAERVAAILTPEQKSLIEKINVAYAGAVDDTGIVYEEKFASVKADQAARKRIQDEKNQDIEEHFYGKLDGILSTSQKEAMTRAAEEEAKRSATAAGTKKPVKN